MEVVFWLLGALIVYVYAGIRAALRLFLCGRATHRHGRSGADCHADHLGL